MLQSSLSLVNTRSDALKHLDWNQIQYSQKTTVVLLIQNQLHISSLQGIYNCSISALISRYLMLQSSLLLLSTSLDALQHLDWTQSQFSQRNTSFLLLQNQLHISSLQGIYNCSISAPISRDFIIQS